MKTTGEIIFDKSEYNVWMKSLTDYEVRCIKDCMEEHAFDKAIAFSEWCEWKGWSKVLSTDNIMWFSKYAPSDQRIFYTSAELYNFFDAEPARTTTG